MASPVVAAFVVVLGGLAVVGLLVGAIVYGIKAAAARRARELGERMALASRLGLQFAAQPTEDLFPRFQGLQAMPAGVRRYSENLFAGFYKGTEFRCFDYVYITETRDSKGHRHRTSHYVGVAVANLGEAYPKLTMVPENFGHKLWDTLGGDDIDFESEEFSRRFWVKCDDRKFAYDVVNPRIMELLMAPGWNHWEINGALLVAWNPGRMAIAEVEPALDRIVTFIGLIPGFVRSSRTANPQAVPAGSTWQGGWWKK